MERRRRPVMLLRVLKTLTHLLMEGHEEGMPMDLNRSQRIALIMMNDYHGISMGFLGHRMNLRKGSVTALVDSLEEKGLVRRRRAEDDRRIVCLTPTVKGRRVAGEIEERVQETIEKNLSVLSGIERAAFLRAVAVIAETTKTLEEKRYGT